MDFSFSLDQIQLRAAITELCARFDETYWALKDREGTFPEEFHRAVAEAGWLGIAMPEEFGGSGLGITEAAIMMQAVAESGGGHERRLGDPHEHLRPQSGGGLRHEDQKRRMLPPMIRGEDKACFAVTEPNTGLNTTQLKTRAEKRGAGYRVSGRRSGSRPQRSRTRCFCSHAPPRSAKSVARPTGLTLFYTDLDRSRVEIREIEKMGRHAVDSNVVFFDGMEIPEEDRIGAEGEGFRAILHGMNPERILIAAEAIGIGRAAVARSARYAAERVVFGRPIGQNQAIQHPLAKCWAELEAANLMVLKAASLYDRGEECGIEANAAKYLAAEAAFRACEQAVLTHGGMGYRRTTSSSACSGRASFHGSRRSPRT